jgi:hypothetical protein
VVRGSFQVNAGEAENEVARKLEMGLTVLGLNSLENLGLLLNLLGLKPPEGAITGLDGVLIGLRTRDLLRQLLEFAESTRLSECELRAAQSAKGSGRALDRKEANKAIRPESLC